MNGYDFFFDVTFLLSDISELGLLLIRFFSSFFKNLNQVVSIPVLNVEVSIFELMFGYALSVFVTITVYKWVKSIIPFA